MLTIGRRRVCTRPDRVPGSRPPIPTPTENTVLKFVVVLLVIWLALSIVGAIVEGLLWLTMVGAVLFLATAAYGFLKRRSGPQIR